MNKNVLTPITSLTLAMIIISAYAWKYLEHSSEFYFLVLLTRISIAILSGIGIYIVLLIMNKLIIKKLDNEKIYFIGCWSVAIIAALMVLLSIGVNVPEGVIQLYTK